MKTRVQYLDILKAIAIFLVVFCHFVLLPQTAAANILMCACWMAVPTFFMVNGALLFARPLKWKKHLWKTLSVYLVLVVWKLIYMATVPFMSGGSLAGSGIGALFESYGVNAVLNYLFLFGELPGIVNGHLWFIEALLAVYLMFPVLRIVFDYGDVDCHSTTSQKSHFWNQADGSKPSISGRRILWFLAIASLLSTNGLHSLEILGRMLRAAGVPFQLSFEALMAFQPFGKYGNMLGFFLLGALLGNPAASSCEHNSRAIPITPDSPSQRIIAAVMLLIGLLSLWGVKWFLSGQPEWDGILLEEGYRHVPVILMAVGLFLLFRNVTIPGSQTNTAADKSSPGSKIGCGAYFVIRALASRTLGIFYIHWFFGWLLVNPLAAFLVSHGVLMRGVEFGVGANILKNVVLMVPAFLVTLLLERIPVVKKLVQG